MFVNPALEAMLELFEYRHLPEHLQAASKPFHDLAWEIAQRPTQRPAEQMACLRKLREAKDCSVTMGIPLGGIGNDPPPLQS